MLLRDEKVLLTYLHVVQRWIERSRQNVYVPQASIREKRYQIFEIEEKYHGIQKHKLHLSNVQKAPQVWIWQKQPNSRSTNSRSAIVPVNIPVSCWEFPLDRWPLHFWGYMHAAFSHPSALVSFQGSLRRHSLICICHCNHGTCTRWTLASGLWHIFLQDTPADFCSALR